MSSGSDKGSEHSNSPDEDAAAAAPAAEETPATVTPATKKRKKAEATASATRDLVVECMRVGMGQIFDEKQVGAACAAILASSSVEELVLKLETQLGAKPKAPGPEFKGRIRSAYTMFVMLVFGALKEAGIGSNLQDVSGLWQALPEDVRLDITERFDAIKTNYNAAVDAGLGPNLTETLATHAEEARLQPINYMDIYDRYKDAAKAAAAAAAAGGGKPKGKGKAKGKPGKQAAAAAPAAAAAAAAPAAAAAAAPATEGKHKKHKKDKEKKKDKKHKAEAEAGATTDKKKKKHKHDS